MDIDDLVSKGQLTRMAPAHDMAEKEWKESDSDLEEAEKELGSKGYKWAIIKAYYAMFHSAKAVLFLLGLKERSHFAVGEMLGIFSREGRLEASYVNDFKGAMSAREGADYHYAYDQRTAEEMVAMAKGFAKMMRKLTGKLKKTG
jgi:uncharacterized protein (UPF0332 family)